MTRIEPERPRFTLTEKPEGLEIKIPARRNWFLTLFIGFWLCGSAFGEFTVSTRSW